eukprot:1149058-Pelagomonas_calceolata.AAC.5
MSSLHQLHAARTYHLVADPGDAMASYRKGVAPGHPEVWQGGKVMIHAPLAFSTILGSVRGALEQASGAHNKFKLPRKGVGKDVPP